MRKFIGLIPLKWGRNNATASERLQVRTFRRMAAKSIFQVPAIPPDGSDRTDLRAASGSVPLAKDRATGEQESLDAAQVKIRREQSFGAKIHQES